MIFNCLRGKSGIFDYPLLVFLHCAAHILNKLFIFFEHRSFYYHNGLRIRSVNIVKSRNFFNNRLCGGYRGNRRLGSDDVIGNRIYQRGSDVRAAYSDKIYVLRALFRIVLGVRNVIFFKHSLESKSGNVGYVDYCNRLTFKRIKIILCNRYVGL